MAEIFREIGMIARALDSIANISFKEYDLTEGSISISFRIYKIRASSRKSWQWLKLTARTAQHRHQKTGSERVRSKREPMPLTERSNGSSPTEKGEAISPNISRENEHSERVALQGCRKEATVL